MFTGRVYGSREYKGKMITLTHTKQAYAAYIAGDITEADYKDCQKCLPDTRSLSILWGQQIPCVQQLKYLAFLRMEMPVSDLD